MKKSLFLLIALVFALGICLVACDINGGDTHTHSFGEWVTIKKVTCSDEGEMARYCDCGEEQIETLPPNGEHTEVIDEAVAPTCTKSGLTDGKHCSVCNTILVQQDIIPALEHTYNTYYSFDNNFHWYACRDCGFAKDKAEHQVGDDDMCTLCDNLIGATEGVIYEKSNDGTYAIVVEYNGSAKKVIIPDTYEGLPVTTIYSDAFKNNDSIISVIFPDSLTSIGDRAFYDCTSLSSVVFGDSLTSIGSDAFYDCDSLSSVVLPDSLTSIGHRAFTYCHSLISVVLPDSLTSIGSYAFDSCDSLQFNEYENGKYLGSESNPYFALIEVTTKNLSSYTIHEDTVIIANGVFYGFGGLTSITIPDNVTSIGSSAFRYCTSLSSVVLPDSLTSIGHRAFDYCTSLTDVYYTGSEEEWQSIDNYYLINAEIHYNYVPEN